VDVPIINKRQAQVINVKTSSQTVEGKTITERTANVMDLESYETFDMKIPEEMVGKVVEGSQVLYWEVTGKKIMQRLA
jgi:translation initiation factor 5A